MNVSIEDPIVPSDVVADGPIVTRPWWGYKRLWFAAGSVAFAVIAYLGLNAYEVPYYEYHPGSARAIAPLVHVEGADAFPPTQPIALTTISLRSSTAWSWMMAHFDDDVEIRTRDQVLSGNTDSERREMNLQMMDTSKQDAIRSALVALGHDVPINVDGQFVVGIIGGSNAEGVLAVGDVILSIDGSRLTDQSDVPRLMEGRRAGETVDLVVERVDETVENLAIELVKSDDGTDRGVVGVFLQPRGIRYEFPFDVQIDTGDVGGPSAGLAFSLGVLDVLTPGDLTGPHQVAVTGTIDAYGNVGNVGGVPQKTAAAIDAGFDVFIVPTEEVDQARERAGDDLQVIGVDTLAEALDALASLGGSGLPSGAE